MPDRQTLAEVAAAPRRADEDELRAARDALGRAERGFRAVFDGSPAGIIVADAVDRRVVDANRSALQCFGCSLDALLGRPIEELTHPADRDRTSRYHGDLIAGRCPEHRTEKRYLRVDGSAFWVELIVTLLRDGDAGGTYLIASFFDITPRRQAEQAVERSQAQLRRFVEKAQIPIAMLDRDGIYLACSGRWRTLFDADAQCVDGLPWHAAHADLPPHLRDAKRRALGGETLSADAEPWERADGSSRWLRWTVMPWHDTAGEVGGVIVSIEDITAARQSEEALRVAAIAFESQEGMMVTDPRGVILRVNRAFSRITGFASDEAVGRTPGFLKSGRHDQAFYARMWETVVRDGYWQGELVNRRRDGDLYTEWLTISAVRDETGAVTQYVGAMADVTKEREARARARFLADFDPLTELPNRSLLTDRIDHALAASERADEHGALLMVDLDHFKNINDSLGHGAGDGVLVQVARRLRLAVRESDTLGRFSGDEFVVVMEDLGADERQAAHRATELGERLRQALADPIPVGDAAVVCTASIGVTTFRGASKRAETLLGEAELAMYRAKARGRNALRLFSPRMQAELDARNALEADLRVALQRGDITVHFQPQVDASGHIVGAEALARWTHPARGAVQPDQFIPIAEDSGLIDELGRQVLETACRRLATWALGETTRELRLAINVSARQFRQQGFVDGVRDALQRSGADSGRLEIEITESLVLENIDDAVAKLRELRAMGIGISLDDFGTGNSSLSYLTRLPLDQLKIDKSFVRELPASGGDALIARTVIAMGKGLGLEVLAEGVESEAQFSYLAGQGCDTFQGFRFARALPPDEFERYVAATRHGAAMH